MPRGVELRELHPAFEAGYNAHDLDRVLELYAPGATLARQDGTYLTGLEAIRDEQIAKLALIVETAEEVWG